MNPSENDIEALLKTAAETAAPIRDLSLTLYAKASIIRGQTAAACARLPDHPSTLDEANGMYDRAADALLAAYEKLCGAVALGTDALPRLTGEPVKPAPPDRQPPETQEELNQRIDKLNRPHEEAVGPYLADRIHFARRKSGLTREYIADAVGVNKNTLSGWTSGRTTPTPQNLTRLADVLCVPTDFFFSTQKAPAPQDPPPKATKRATKQAIGNRIRWVRQQVALTQRELGEAVGISDSAIANLENGKVSTVRKYIPELAAFLDVPEDYLLCKSDKLPEDM